MTDYNDYDEWPDLITPQNVYRLLDIFPESKLLQVYALPKNSTERAAAWADLGVTDPLKQQALEVELDNLIAALASKRGTNEEYGYH